MPSAEEYLAEPPLYLVLVCGMPDSGKSDLAMTFPGCYVLTFDPTGFNILKGTAERARSLAKNLRHIETIQPLGSVETLALFSRTKVREKGKAPEPVTGEDRDSLYGCLKHVEEGARAGRIKTLVLDGLNYFVDLKWTLICSDSKNLSQNTGELDRFAAYRDLKNFLGEFIWSRLLPMCTRLKLNLVVTVHVKRESEEVIQGVTNKQTGLKAAGKVSHDSDLAPVIEGSFRNTIDGKFGAVIWLEHKQGLIDVGGGVKKPGLTYWAYCKKTQALDTVINAKNKYGLPARLDLTNRSFYEELLARTGGLPVQQAETAQAIAQPEPSPGPKKSTQVKLGVQK